MRPLAGYTLLALALRVAAAPGDPALFCDDATADNYDAGARHTASSPHATHANAI